MTLKYSENRFVMISTYDIQMIANKMNIDLMPKQNEIILEALNIDTFSDQIVDAIKKIIEKKMYFDYIEPGEKANEK